MTRNHCFERPTALGIYPPLLVKTAQNRQKVEKFTRESTSTNSETGLGTSRCPGSGRLFSSKLSKPAKNGEKQRELTREYQECDRFERGLGGPKAPDPLLLANSETGLRLPRGNRLRVYIAVYASLAALGRGTPCYTHTGRIYPGIHHCIYTPREAIPRVYHCIYTPREAIPGCITVVYIPREAIPGCITVVYT